MHNAGDKLANLLGIVLAVVRDEPAAMVSAAHNEARTTAISILVWSHSRRSGTSMDRSTKLSHKYIQRYVDEFTGRHNMRDLDAEDQRPSSPRLWRRST